MRREIPIRELDPAALARLSTELHLSLSAVEMGAIREHFRGLHREPSDLELETLAQTWSEHCKHKTLTGTVDYEDVDGRRRIDNLLKVDDRARRRGGSSKPWCLSVFKDNAGVIAFDDEDAVCMKVETHNHPSAIEPYGGAGTGIGGVIRDILGTGLGARPVASTDVFCFGPPDMPDEEVPKGCMSPTRLMRGVVAGRARLRQPHGDPDGQRGDPVRPPLRRQPGRLLRLRRHPAPIAGSRRPRSPATSSSRSAAARAATASTARRSRASS